MSRPAGSRSGAIHIIGADANNLKSVDVNLPRNGATVITGVSGSGKSSLLAHTLAAEGARRTRTFFGAGQKELERRDVRAFIDQLPPTVLVGQRGFRPSVRTTVGTATGLLSAVRKLFLAASVPVADEIGEEVPPASAVTYAAWLARHYRGKAEIWAVPLRQAYNDGTRAISSLEAAGLEVVKIYSETDPPKIAHTGKTVRTRDFRALNPTVWHTIEACVAQLDVRGPSSEVQLLSCLERAFSVGQGSVVVMLPESSDRALGSPYGQRLDSSLHWVHPASSQVFRPASVHLLSFNAPAHPESGACEVCAGTGRARQLRLHALVKDPRRSIAEGAFALWTPKNYKYVNIQHETINGLEGRHGFSARCPWAKLPEPAKDLILRGAGDELIQDLDEKGRKFGKPRRFRGFEPIILEKAANGSRTSERLAELVEDGPCSACNGSRWSRQARALQVGGKGLAEILSMPFSDLAAVTLSQGEWRKQVSREHRRWLATIHEHAESLKTVGLGYLSGDRGMLEVSGGESRRVRLARVLAARETGFCLLFDEPARGLHEADLPRLRDAFHELKGRHTVVLNEHRQHLWSLADHFLEMGPGAGAAGGEITYEGTHAGRHSPVSNPQRTSLPVPASNKRLTIKGATLHNLKGVDCSIPLGRLTCVCGVSGSGKSSFVRGVLAPAVSADGGLEGFEIRPDGRWKAVIGAEHAGAVIALDQSIASPNRRSLLATSIGVLDRIRQTFGRSKGAKAEGLTSADFGLNSGRGRCQICLGIGEVDDDNHRPPCPACGGARYGPAALAVRVAGLNVRELLDTSVVDLIPIADEFDLPRDLLEAISSLGVGYLSLGRRLDTLSGGELQRVKLAIRLAGGGGQGDFFILDEPAAGLHHKDVDSLIRALDRLVDGGRNTVVVVDHDLDLIRTSDWLVEFGPGAGKEGGKIVFEGAPSALMAAETPTGEALRGEHFARARSRTRPPARASEQPPLPERARRTEMLLKTLLGGDAPVEIADEEVPAAPAAAIDRRQLDPFSWWEAGGLHLEVPKLLLDMASGQVASSREALLEAWSQDEGARLGINPFLSDLAIWGRALPKSAVKEALKRMRDEGLCLWPMGEAEAVGDPSRAFATGPRFSVEAGNVSREDALRDAWAIGGGYAELRNSDGRVLAVSARRFVDLGKVLVGPLAAAPGHFSRHEAEGRCVTCAGRRTVAEVDVELIVRSHDCPPHEDAFLTPPAADVSRGVRRSGLLPLLRRLEREGLWDMSVPFGNLSDPAKTAVLHGYWIRPGPGTFLKSASADPAEVGSWLRWDGFSRELLRESGRSKDRGWAQELAQTARDILCPTCRGSGLRPHAELLTLGDSNFQDWSRLKDARRQTDALKALKPTSPRQKEAHRRLVSCLSAGSSGGERVLIEAAVRAFTTAEPWWR